MKPKPRTIELVRAVIHVESVLGDRRGEDGSWIFTLGDDPRIAHVRIVSFGDRTADEFANVMRKLHDEGVQAIVLDLRDNAGGSLDAAVAVCEMLLPAGKTIVETRGRDQVVRQRYATTSDGEYREIPLAVLVNQQQRQRGRNRCGVLAGSSAVRSSWASDRSAKERCSNSCRWSRARAC